MSGIRKRRRAEKVMVEMGFKDAMNTIIGGRSSKGVGGEQRRRVSICIEILTLPKLLFLDEPMSGLDSAASYHVMNIIVTQARRHCGTVIISIHQPSCEVFELFDNLCLLCSGTTVYFGPTSLTAQVFAANGFPCPQMRNPCDHFLRTINKDFDTVVGQNKNYVHKQNTKEAIEILTNSYNSSNISLPFHLLISVVAAASSYDMTGLQTNPQHFAFFALIIYSSMIIVEGLMMIVAAVVPDFLMGIITGAGIQGWMLRASGFFRPPRDMPKPLWVYPAYYIAFQRYATQGLYKNEFIGLFKVG
ncbi:ABC transporter G family member 11 [Platanthera guangdongensis]|uniref:ABC transporter G family member 11 n=1 Tax=Platanthera guangdongensis TaxID=2320717 RepID=A0ABR2LIY2_9ASPA